MSAKVNKARGLLVVTWTSYIVADVKPRLVGEESKPTKFEDDFALPNVDMNPGLVKEGTHICATIYLVTDCSCRGQAERDER